MYVVEFGEYSDRNVSGVYSTEERAQIAATGGGDITEYEVDTAFDLYDRGLRPFFITISYSGDVLKTSKDEYATDTKTRYGVSTSKYATYPETPVWDCLDVRTWAKDEQHAIKIASEHHAEAIADGWDGVHHYTPKTAGFYA